ncbi:MAG: CD225/dispanin family protein [Segniliparus sp.]|uniref:CD225/dispanin family protein n=1 Tax=Segniliparus sp. TaxID=2804064 RepID=UPI003F3472E9
MTYPPGQQFPGSDPNQPSLSPYAASGPVGGPAGLPSAAGPANVPPPSNIGWAIAGAFFLLPLALAAFFASSKVEVLWRLGDFAGAEKASADAKKWGSLALWIGLGLLALGCISYVGLIAAAVSSIPSTS